MISNMYLENEENDLLNNWFVDISQKREMYKEPILRKRAVRFFKQICDALEQNSHVFVMSIEVAEEFVRAKKSNKQKIGDALLAAVTIVFMCHKCEGARETLKVRHVVDLMSHISKKAYKHTQITSMEGDVLVTLNGKLPVTTVLDDMDIIMETYLEETKLKVNFRPLCLKILEYVYMERQVWFRDLKEVYSQNEECVNVFHHLVSSKFYIPVCIVIAAIELTRYQHILDTEIILTDATKHTKIHEDHLKILKAKFIEMIKYDGK